MKMQSVVRWGLTVVMTLVLALPVLAKPDRDRDDDHGDRDDARVRITIQQNDANDDTRVYRQWYGAQVGGFNEIDKETGERIGDLLQLVADVGKDRIIITDRDNARRTVLLNGQTRVIFVTNQPGNGYGNGHGNGYGPNGRMADAARHLDEGDLVILGGYLKADGSFVASQIRVMGEVRRWGGGNDDYRPTYGQRAWGEVVSVDYRYGRIEVNTDTGRRSIYLERGGEILGKGQKQTLQYLHKGDRVVYYYRNTPTRNSFEVYRIVILDKVDVCPDGNRPHCADPDYKQGGNNAPNLPALDARLEGISTGTLFNKLTISTNNGKQVNVYVSKSVDATDDRGNRISLLNLRYGDRLRIYYTEVAGVLFAQQIEVR
jgi:hypothetical protein